MTTAARTASYVPRRYASGTFPVSKDYSLRQMLYNHSSSGNSADNNNNDINGDSSSHQVIPSFPFSDVPVYADTVDLETLGFHRVWGCLLTPDNVAASIVTDTVRYHVWVATKRVMDSGLFNLDDKEALRDAVMDQFMVELGLVLVDMNKGPLILFVDPRFHGNSKRMVAKAMAMVNKFDEAHVLRWRIIVTLPATEEGIYAARELQMRHGVNTNLSLVSCVEQAAACIEAGASMINMQVQSIISWFEAERDDIQPGCVSRDHPGIQMIQSCANFIRHHGINTTLLTTDVQQLDHLKELDGIGSTALSKELLDQMTMRHMVTWYPRPDGTSPATLHAPQVPYPTHYLDSRDNFMLSFPTARLSMIWAILYVELDKMAVHMKVIDKAVEHEIARRIRLETIPLEELYARPTNTDLTTPEEPQRSRSRSRSSKAPSPKSRQSRSRKRRSPQEKEEINRILTQFESMVEDVDYF